MGKPARSDVDRSGDARYLQTVYIRRVEKVNGQLRNVEIAKIENVKDPVKARMK